MATGNYTVLDGNGSAIFFQTESGDGSQATPFVPAVLPRGGMTAAGTVTAEVKGTLTAEAKGTVTAEVKGTLTAQTKGILTAMVSGGDFYLGSITAGGQLTAHGTVTAEAKGTVTAEVKGTLTAQTKGVLTAMVSGGDFYLGTITAGGELTAHGTITAQVKGGTASVYSVPSTAWLLSANNAIGTGSALGALAKNYGYVVVWASGNSASANLLGSIDSANWSQITAWSLGADTTATAQVTGYFPYLAGRVSWVSAEGAASGTVWMQGAGVK